MDQLYLLEVILDNLPDGVYVLDDRGNYIFVNSAYVQALNMPKDVLLHYNVHDFLNTGQIDICVSDIVYREKRQVVMFQDVLDTQNYGRDTIRQMIISTPIFDDSGKIRNILAVVRPLDRLNQLYYQATQAESVSSISGLRASPPVKGSAVIAESPAMRAALSTAATVAVVDSAVLISGESGTGKEVVAQYIHDASPRSGKPLVVINCASLPENLLEAELFGYEKGAFTGAAPGGKAGLFEAADGGTIFLDEIGEIPLQIQAKLLSVIQNKVVCRVGSTRSVPVDVRILAATNRDLRAEVAAGRFRQDLYYRLSAFSVELPPLRSCPEDVCFLIDRLMEKIPQKYGVPPRSLSGEAFGKLLAYNWPGNIRELENVLENAVALSESELIYAEHIHLEGTAPAPLTLKERLKREERQILRQTLAQCGGSRVKAMELLGLSKTVFYGKLKEYQLD